ncbi:MAG: hypothetical protein Q9211_004866 [Gyalolechia sp. 1 TL-2023]
MAEKEATVYIVDVGASMGEKHNGRNTSDLDYAMTYVWDKITSTMITKYCKKLKYKRRIVLITDGRGSLDDDPASISEITKKITQDDMELVIIGVDFDDPEYGFKEEDKEPQKAQNEQTFKALADACGGVIGTLQQAVEELGMPRLKSTRPVPSYKGLLSLGDSAAYESAICIDVERYPRTSVRRPLTASQYVQRMDSSQNTIRSSGTVLPDGDTEMADAAPNDLTNVKSSRTYQVLDEEAPGGKRDVSRDDLAKGYEYGRTAVHINETDENVTKLETQAALEVIGFIPWANYDRYMSMSCSNIVIAQKTNSKAIMALSSLIHALFELESYAIARLVPKADKPPVILLLAPSIEVDYECLLDVQIPFAEDVRSYKFPPLDRVITVSGKVVKEHRNLPNDTLSSAMSDYIDSMDLSTFGRDEEGNPSEYMPMADTFSPVLHRIDQAVRWRAVHPTEPIPPPYEILVRYSQPPEDLVSSSKRKLEKLMAAADIKKVPPKVQGRRRDRNEVKPLSGLNVEALIGGDRKRAKISSQNTIPDFRQTVNTVDSVEGMRDAAQQLGVIVETRIRDSFGDIAYTRAIEEIRVMREEMIDLEEPEIYNDFVKALKRKLLAEELGGNRKDFWWEFRKSRLGLIDKQTSEASKATEEDAKASFEVIDCPALPSPPETTRED